MQIGAIGIGSFQPYVYNTNSLSKASMNKINKIGDDLLASKTDFSALADEQKNVNPLKRGETLDFAGMLSMQMQMSQMNAARLLREPERPQEEEMTQPVTQAADTMISRDMDQYMQAADAGIGAGMSSMFDFLA